MWCGAYNPLLASLCMPGQAPMLLDGCVLKTLLRKLGILIDITKMSRHLRCSSDCII